MNKDPEIEVVLNLPEDINKLCRTCMSVTENLQKNHEIFVVQESKLTEVAQMLEEFSFLKISVEDGLPNSICEQCSNQLEIAYNFKYQCKKTEASLREILNLPFENYPNETNNALPNGVIMYDCENDQTANSRKYDDKNFEDTNKLTFENEMFPFSPTDLDINISDSDIFSLIEERKQHLTQELVIKEEIEIKEENQESLMIKEEIDSNDDLSYQCNTCTQIFSTYDNFQIHIENCGNCETPHAEILDKILNLEEFKTESVEECNLEKKKYGCNICGAHFESKYQRNGHISTHRIVCDKKPLQKYEFVCDICNKTFISESKLIIHFHNHALKLNNKMFSTTVSDEEIQDEGEEPNCYICDDKFVTSKMLSDHIKREHMISGILICEICGREYSTEINFAVHLKKHGVQIHLCKICLKKYNSHEMLRNHLKLHRTEKNKNSYCCPICKQQFLTQKELKAHSLEHLDDSYECPKCKKKFYNIVTYKIHLKKHTEPRFLCSLCGKQYFSSVTLASHIRSHNNEKPFKCPHCVKAFSSRATLSVHKRIHSTFKPYICSYCGYSCRQSGDLAMHIRTHTGDKPYKCTFPNCDRKFTTSSQRKEHYRRHTNERNHKCTVCDRAFLESKTLKVHMLTHTGEKPHSCEICGKKFRRTHHLTNHMKGHREFLKI